MIYAQTYLIIYTGFGCGEGSNYYGGGSDWGNGDGNGCGSGDDFSIRWEWTQLSFLIDGESYK